MSASSMSGINTSRFINADYAPTANFELFMTAAIYAKASHTPIKAGTILCSDEFYEDDYDSYKRWADFGVLCVEMKTAGLYTIEAKLHVKALSILTISDSLVTKESTSVEDRESTFNTMLNLRYLG